MKIRADKDFGSRECPGCGVRVEANHNHCPICRYAFPHPGPTRRRLRLYGTLILLAVLLITFLSL